MKRYIGTDSDGKLTSITFIGEINETDNIRTLNNKYKTVHENAVMINSPKKNKIIDLDRFTPLKNGEMLEDLDGEYVLLEDVLALFSAQA